jgi:hypothetical protein
VTFPEIDPKFEFRRPSIAQDVVLRDVTRRTPLYLTPFALAGTSRTAVAPTTTVPRYTTRDANRGEVGLDARYALARPHGEHRLRAGGGR